MSTPGATQIIPRDRPVYRKLRGYAFDPSLSGKLDTAAINDVVYKVRWEELTDERNPAHGPGPVGEYIEVVDFDPTVGPDGTLYEPVDLNDPYILAGDGLTPSESNPQFHQQFVYAAAMLTIQNFEQALGRKILWAPRVFGPGTPERKKNIYEEYVPRLRIYPHAVRIANAYYSPLKKAVLCGYFSASPKTAAQQMPGSLVFSCLSQDIVAHEVTHAILDGLHRHYNRATNPDVLAFHEAFADIVALFQHFTFPEVLKHQIAKTRGDLEKQNLLGELAQQVGVAMGEYNSLRDAIGGYEKDPQTKKDVWKLKDPKPTDYERTKEPHGRGSILVAAVFEAFLTIYKNRVKDLLRIATGGTGILPQGDIHPDLVNRLAGEASKTATQVLTMCVRAIDFCPPVDITFGEYLRAVITADYEMVKDDPQHFRLAFIEAFRRRGIYPEGIRTLSEESLRYRDESRRFNKDTRDLLGVITKFLKEFRGTLMYEQDRAEVYAITKKFISGVDPRAKPKDKHFPQGLYGLHHRLNVKFGDSRQFEELTGLVFGHDWRALGADAGGVIPTRPSFQVLDLRIASRVGPDGNLVNHIVFELVQRIGVVYEKGRFQRAYRAADWKKRPRGGSEIRGGCTLIFDLDSACLKYAITKPLTTSGRGGRKLNLAWIDRVRSYQDDELPLQMADALQLFGSAADGRLDEPFAMLHQHSGERDDS